MNEVESQISKMTKDELESFLLTTQIISRCCNVAGVGSVILCLMMPSILIYIVAFTTIYFVGNLAVGADNTQAEILKALKTKE